MPLSPRKDVRRYRDGQPLAGAAVVVLVCRYGGTRAVYTPASFSGQLDFAFQRSCICVTLVSQNQPVLLTQAGT